MNEVKDALKDILEESIFLVREMEGYLFASQIEVVWNARMRSTAGRAYWPSCRIELNPKLLRVGIDEVRRTLLHELAHLLAYHRAGRRRIQPHGAEWQQACAELGIAGEKATHNLPLPTRRQKRHWVYRCPSCEVEIERVRRMKGLQACYECCQSYSDGSYDSKFRLIEEKTE